MIAGKPEKEDPIRVGAETG